jgi:alkylated DNA nucleotide flippase Atl1
MLIASPNAITALLRHIPHGHVLPARALRDALAAAYGADYTCPMTTGIFLRMVAESVDSESENVPWWRVVRDDGALFDKHPGGVEEHERLLRRDGVRFVEARRSRADVAAQAWRVTASARSAARRAGGEARAEGA